jgi:soluble lytic murein transglycosylase-like protein
MMQNQTRYQARHVRAIILTLSIAALCQATHIDSFLIRYGIEPVGAQAIREGNFASAIEQMTSDSSVLDTAYRSFKLGLAHTGLQNYGKALFFLRLAAGKDSALAPFIYKSIGDIEYKRGRIVNALNAYRVALDGPSPQRYQQMLYSQMYDIAREYADSIGKIAWLEELVGPLPADSARLSDTLATLLDAENWHRAESLVVAHIATFGEAGLQCPIIRRIAHARPPDSLFDTKQNYKISTYLSQCGLHDFASDWLHRALRRDDFSAAVNHKDYLFYRARLNYDLRNYTNAIKYFKLYEKQYGPTPTLVYLVARSYRARKKHGAANAWYDKHVRLYPHHSKSHDILWYRAWLREDDNDWAGARGYYKRLFSSHSRRGKADDSYFRYALTFYRESLEGGGESSLRKAVQAFTDCMHRYPRAPKVEAARYWRAKCFFKLGEQKRAREECIALSDLDPTNYYSYRARELLNDIDSAQKVFLLDTLYNPIAAIGWLDSISRKSRRGLSAEDSIAYRRGILLAAAGRLVEAETFLEKLEICYPRNTLLQYELASLYQLFDDPTLSYRVARRFAWRIPAEHRARMPLALYSLLYPFSFSAMVNTFAAEFDVSPHLVTAIMRQESIFDPRIVSPVGAIGLMQIMPYTGEEIARDLDEQFSADSLYSPALNVRFGAYYISKLLDQFDDNIVLAIAGYNGGPHNAKRWHKQNKDDEFDLFIEDIGYSETRNYVKKVLANYWTYQRLAKIPAFMPYVQSTAPGN